MDAVLSPFEDRGPEQLSRKTALSTTVKSEGRFIRWWELKSGTFHGGEASKGVRGCSGEQLKLDLPIGQGGEE